MCGVVWSGSLKGSITCRSLKSLLLRFWRPGKHITGHSPPEWSHLVDWNPPCCRSIAERPQLRRVWPGAWMPPLIRRRWRRLVGPLCRYHGQWRSIWLPSQSHWDHWGWPFRLLHWKHSAGPRFPRCRLPGNSGCCANVMLQETPKVWSFLATFWWRHQHP